jgi:oligoribonuclease (3'-5' exoribonuclease)
VTLSKGGRGEEREVEGKGGEKLLINWTKRHVSVISANSRCGDRRFRNQGHPWLHSEFEASLD